MSKRLWLKPLVWMAIFANYVLAPIAANWTGVEGFTWWIVCFIFLVLGLFVTLGCMISAAKWEEPRNANDENT